MTNLTTASLTVVIPHLNSEEGLDRCLASLAVERDMAGLAFPVIVVDNGSERRPDRVCAAYPFVRLADEAEPGPGPARNRGAGMVNTGIIAFIDADCIACPGWVQTIVGHFRAHPKAAVVGGEVGIALADSERPTAIEAYESVYGYRMRLYYERDGYTGTGNMAVRREAFERVGGFAGIEVAEDLDWGRRARAMGLRIDFVPEMRIATPARKSLAELARKWDRHTSHQFDGISSLSGRVLWLAKALALVASPLIEIPTILRSDQLAHARDRWLAFAVLTRIRFYRCRGMLGLLVGAAPRSEAVWRQR